MTKEELEKYAYENRKRLDAQEVKIGDVVKVLRGQFAGETGVVVGIIACGNDYTDPYYEVDMDCEVPDKYKCRKNTLLAQPNNVVGGLSAYDFEVIGNRAPMQPTEEIKVGDNVRVSKDAQEIFVYDLNPLWFTEESTVIGTHLDGVVIKLDVSNHLTTGLAIPTKYLTKVNAEEKEPKFKVGEKVCYNGYVYEIEGVVGKNRYAIKGLNFDLDEDMIEPYEPYTEPTAPTIKVGDKVKVAKNAPKVYIAGVRFVFTEIASTVTKIDYPENNPKDQTLRIEITPFNFMEIPSIYVERVENEEQTEAVKTNPDNFKKIAEEWANEVSNAIEEYGDAMCKIYVEARNEAYWDAYAADLAKEIALKVANKYSDPKEAADYAVSVAKAVVENLKKKRI